MYNLTLKDVRISIVAWKCNKYYILQVKLNVFLTVHLELTIH